MHHQAKANTHKSRRTLLICETTYLFVLSTHSVDIEHLRWNNPLVAFRHVTRSFSVPSGRGRERKKEIRTRCWRARRIYIKMYEFNAGWPLALSESVNIASSLVSARRHRVYFYSCAINSQHFSIVMKYIFTLCPARYARIHSNAQLPLCGL
jgi:hypothetical protein